jgi:hypothetical protein
MSPGLLLIVTVVPIWGQGCQSVYIPILPTIHWSRADIFVILSDKLIIIIAFSKQFKDPESSSLTKGHR